MFYSDGACEFVSAASQLAIPHYPGEPGRSTTHARAERKIRTLKDSIRALVLQAGLPAVRWSWAVHAASVALNLLWTHPDGVSAYAKRFAMPAKAHWLAPFGSLVYAMPPRTRAQTLHPLQPRFVPCVSMGPAVLPAGRVGSAIRALPLDVFIRSGGKTPSSLWITRDWKPCCNLVFPLRDYAPARTASLNLQEETYEFAPLATLKGFILEASDEPVTDAAEANWQEMLRNLPPPTADARVLPSREGGTERDERDDAKRPYPTWDDRSIISAPPDGTTRRLDSVRYDRMTDGKILKVKRDSRRPPWWPNSEAWLQMPLKAREELLTRWKDYHERKLTMSEVREIEGWPSPPEPSFVLEARARDPNVDVRDLEVPVMVSELIDSPSIPDEVMLTSACVSLHRRVRFADRPGHSFAEYARQSDRHTEKAKILLVEFCCQPDSMLGKPLIALDTVVLRVTKEQDVTQKETIRGLMSSINEYISQGFMIHLHCSTPCTGGSALQNVNLARGMSPRKLEQYEDETQIMLKHFGSLARMVKACNGTISIEWPKSCSYWGKGWYKRLQRQCQLESVEFDGCMLGSSPNANGHVVGIAGLEHVRHKKPWRIDSNCAELIRCFEPMVCCQDPRYHTHLRVEGKYTERSGSYPPLMAIRFHQALKSRWLNGESKVACVSVAESVDCVTFGTDSFAESCLDEAQRMSRSLETWADDKLIWSATAAQYDMTLQEAADMGIIPQDALRSDETANTAPEPVHNDTEEKRNMPLMFGLVTETLQKSDPRYHSEAARQAFNKERDTLNRAGTWHPKPMERSQVRKLYPNATFSRVFTILGIKGIETVDNQKYKARSVLQGNHMLNCDGDAVYYTDASSAPTNMAAIRAVIAHGLIQGETATQADGEQAFTQPLLPETVEIWAYIPPELQTDEQRKMASEMKDPVFRLLRPLYGWTCSGKLWEEHLDKALKRCDWSSVEGWPQTYTKTVNGNVLALSVYVDDLVMSGKGHRQEWSLIQKEIRLGEVSEVDRVLGVHHTVIEEGGRKTLKVGMGSFLRSAVSKFSELASAPPLGKIVSTPWRAFPHDEPQRLNQPGVFAKQAPSLLMKLLYAARMTRPDLQWTITTLARQLTRWTKHSDLQLIHLYMYVDSTSDFQMSMPLPSQDERNTCYLELFVDADHAGGEDTEKSTSGMVLCLRTSAGPVLLDWSSKLQTATATSSTEAEILALNRGLRISGYGQKTLWEIFLNREVRLVVREDNSATIKDIESGSSPQLRHVLAKVHRVALGALHEQWEQKLFELSYVASKDQLADIMTKGLPRVKHECALSQLCLGRSSDGASSGVNVGRVERHSKSSLGKSQGTPAMLGIECGCQTHQ
eukprot:6492774-Amphidinium_carterae.4